MIYEVEAPDGSILEIEGPDNATDEQIASFAASQFGGETVPQGTQPEDKRKPLPLTDLLAPWDAGLNLLTGMVAAPVSGLAGLATGGDADVVRSAQEALTYQPRTESGKAATEAIGSVLGLPAEYANKAGEYVAEATGSPALGTGANVAVQAIPALLGSRGVGAMRNNAIRREANNAVTNTTLRDMTQHGYVAPPSQMAQTGAGRAVAGLAEGIAGPEALARDMSARNARVVNAGTRQDAAIPGRGQISIEDLDAARQPHIQVYRQAESVSPTARDAVQEWRQANADARGHDLHYQRSMDPAAQQRANQARADAQTYAQIIESEVIAAGQPQLAGQLAESRVALARIGTVERALNEATGNVNAQALKQARDRGVPIERNPNMNRAANVSEAFRGRLTQPPPVNAPNQSMAATLAAALGGPKALAWTGMPWAMRQALMSRPVQAMARPGAPPTPLSATNELSRAALISALEQQEGR